MVQDARNRYRNAVEAVLQHFHDILDLQFGFELWDGATVPPDLPKDGLRIVLSEHALLRLVRRPSLKTVVDLYSISDIDPIGGSIFDFAEKRPKVKSRDIRKKLNKSLLLKNLIPVLRGPGSSGNADGIEGLDAGKAADRSSGSRKSDIAFHYDVSNDFYRLFLDPELVYTCAYFTDWSNDLATAQKDKLDMICRKLRLKPGERMLDIGCGWGALICHAAEHYGVSALGVTLAEEQAKLARERIAERGLQDRVSVELIDYRDLPKGRFDKISSIGMFEAVGLDNYDNYFQSVHKLLRPRGLYLHHAITRRGRKNLKAFRRKKPEYQALVRYIFPGGEVDHIGWTLTNLEHHGFEVHDVEAWREHYARTTRLWAENLTAVKEAAIAEIGEQRYRLWLAYLCGVSLGFERGSINIFQTVSSKRTKGPSGLPPTRADLY
ncbi:methyltransferase domain-containing protein [Roseibium denhamense]|uniref:Cyclopropane-fatty-acyl-phospholipid synthase n=1 Tax=Roseibium denhamense TaxID=76305 RepID=A0ABY1PK48_9HYPH|nr:class I SAM-dependent methyltransferase [Roseibium denhamense]MTI05911.1 methyltransferase domain-containing protein [Roseibium denhamense]SMP35744.1 cyclopropane-fatty-acyl-phospholipid synthase [Roseibium denhamense]